LKNHIHHKKSTIWENLRGWKGIWFHLAGIIAVLWFLIRVVPKPQRAQYPCQQIAMSISLGYIAFWGILFTGLVIWMRNVKTRWAKTVPTLAAGFVVLFTITGAVFATGYFNGNEPTIPTWTPIPKQPMGNGTGINPGRVVWEWNPSATEKNLTGYWWEKQNNNQSTLDSMFSQGLCELTGAQNASAAWTILFHYFNLQHGFADVGYQPGEKIAIKINLNNVMYHTTDPYTYMSADRDASPYVVKALLRQLVNIAGVPQRDITVLDASREMPNWFYYRVYYTNYPAVSLVPEFPNVTYADVSGGTAGREKVIPSTEHVYIHNGSGLLRTLPTCIANAKYLFDMPLLKRHPVNMGVTLSGKNLYGSFIEPVIDGLHQAHVDSFTMGNPAPATALLADKDLGGKMLLYIGDGTFATKVDHKTIAKFLMYPFNNDWTNSLFFSQDPIAMDSVMYDFLYTEGTNPCEGSQNYLHQAAVPPVNVYDPENDGAYLSTSLGVHEHWDPTMNIFSANRYSGPAGHGIDFQAYGEQYARPGVVIATPLEKHLYFMGKNISFPWTMVIGNIDVEARVNGDVGAIQKVEFYKDNALQFTDSEAPFVWSWNTFSLFKHTIKVTAYYDTVNTTSSEIIVWKLF
jgi:hypothetical protein